MKIINSIKSQFKNTLMQGISVSYWQGNVNWSQVAKSGVGFAIIREGHISSNAAGVTDDGSGTDLNFEKNLTNAKKNGISCGIYRYTDAKSVDDAIKEANFCLNNIANRKLEFPVVFSTGSGELGLLGKDEAYKIIDAFCSKIRNACYYPMIYTNSEFYKNFIKDTDLVKKYDIWIAYWQSANPNNSFPDPEIDYGIWEFTNSGKINGIAGPVTLNSAYKNYPQIMMCRELNGFGNDY